MKPGSRSPGLSFSHGVVEIRVQEHAREGKANAACRKALAKALGVAPSSVRLVRGESARVKLFAIESLTPPELAARLARLRP